MKTEGSRILVTGANGALGEAVCALFSDACDLYPTDIAASGFSGAHLDISSASAVRGACISVRPDVIINLAAMTDLEECERNPSAAYETNTWGVHNLLQEARAREIPFVHISTAGVFDGARPSYNEDDAHKANPLSVYGKSKYAGELIAGTYQKSLILRSGWMIGGGPLKDKKFVGKIIAQVAAGTSELFVVHDKLGTPSYTYDIARLMLSALKEDRCGLYHACCHGGGSRVDVAECVINAFSLQKKVAIRPVASDYFKKDYFAPRPSSEIIANTLCSGYGRDYKECIDEYVKKFDWGVHTS